MIPEREEIAPAVERLAHRLFRREVARLALRHAGHGQVPVRRRLRDPEVDQLQRAGRIEEQVVRRDVAVDEVQVALARKLQPVHRLERGAGRDPHREQRIVGQPRALGAEPAVHARERLAAHQLHRHECAPVRLTDLVDVDDVRVRERARGPRLVEEHLAEVRRLRVLGADHLQRDRAGDPPGEVLLGAIDLGHPALSDQAHDAEATDGGSGRDGHGARGDDTRSPSTACSLARDPAVLVVSRRSHVPRPRRPAPRALQPGARRQPALPPRSPTTRRRRSR